MQCAEKPALLSVANSKCVASPDGAGKHHQAESRGSAGDTIFVWNEFECASLLLTERVHLTHESFTRRRIKMMKKFVNNQVISAAKSAEGASFIV